MPIVTPKQLSDRGELYHQLGVLVASGISIVSALEMMERNPPHRSLRPIAADVGKFLREGHTVTDAVHRSGAFPPFDAALLESGDKSGRLDACFKLLSEYYHERAKSLRIVLAGLAYPALLLHMAVVIFPFIEYFKTNSGRMFVLQVFGVLIPIYALVIFIVYSCQGSRGETWRARVESILRRVPLLGTARNDLALARLTAALEALLNAGVPIIGGWELAAAASGSPALQRIVSGWRTNLERGATPAEMVSNSGAFPEPFGNLYHTGEVTGQLDDILKRLHVLYREEGNRKMQMASVMFSKIVYGCVAGFVAWKVISFYQGLYGSGSDLDRIMNGFDH